MGTMDRLHIRDARPDERDAIRALTFAAYGEFATVMEPGAWAGLRGALETATATEEGAERIVAERDGRLVGSVMLFAPAENAYGGLIERLNAPELRLLAVHPDARGQGVGEALVREVIRRARASGAAELGLHTSDTLAVAMRMYERMGFVRAPAQDFHPQGAELVKGYRLDLGGPAAG